MTDDILELGSPVAFFGPHDKDELIGYMAVMITLAIEKIKMGQSEIAIETLVKAQTAYLSSLSIPTDKRL